MIFIMYDSGPHFPIGKKYISDSIEKLLESGLTKRDRQFWQVIKYVNEDNKLMVITREYIEDQGMSLEEVKDDWEAYGEVLDQYEAPYFDRTILPGKPPKYLDYEL